MHGGNSAGDTASQVRCRLCHRWYRAITYAHLKYRHGIEAPKDYKDEFSLEKITSREVCEKVAYSKRVVGPRSLEYIRKNWGRSPLSAITDHVGVHSSTVRDHAKRLGLSLYVRKWDRRKLIAEIRRAHRAGIPLHSGAARRLIPQVYRSARYGKHFRSWKRAVEAAGLRYSRISRRAPFESWSPSRIRLEIRKLAGQGKHRGYAYLARYRSKLYAAARNHFGNWRRAVKAALRS